MIIDGSKHKLLTEAEQRQIQGAGFVKASGVPFVVDDSPRNWDIEQRKQMADQQNAQPGATRTASDIEQARIHGLSVLENSR